MKVRRWKTSLRVRLVTYFLVLSLMTVGLLGVIAFFQARVALQNAVIDRLEVAASLKETALSQWVNDQVVELMLVITLPEVKAKALGLAESNIMLGDVQSAYDGLSSIIDTIMTRKPQWNELLLLSDKSEVLYSTNASHEGDYRILDRFFTEGKEGVSVQKVYPSPVTYKPTITVSAPLQDEEGKTIGVIGLHLNLERMDQIILEETGLGIGSESYLVDQYNEFISSDRFGRDAFDRGVHSEGIDQALKGIDGFGLYENYRGVPVLGVYTWIDELEVALLTEISQRDAFAPARALATIILLVGLVMAVLLAAGISLIARQIARPILGITSTAIQVADGDLSARAPIMTEDEVGVLATTFNRMTERLGLLYNSLNEEIVERQRAEMERERVQADLEQIHDATNKMQQLLNELLELSRIGRQVNKPSEISLSELAEEAVGLVRGGIVARGVELQIDPQMPIVMGDRIRLLEVFQNLIDNAVKFLGDQKAPVIEVGARGNENEVVCFVRDNGIGIEPQYHDKIFGLFDRLDPTTEGTGIGLALVKRIIEVHGGKIWVESPGEEGGTTFLFSLPMK